MFFSLVSPDDLLTFFFYGHIRLSLWIASYRKKEH